MIDAARVHALLDFPTLIEVLRSAHLGGMPEMVDRVIYDREHSGEQPDNLILITAWQPGEGMLAKVTTVFPRNPTRHGVPSVNSLYLFADGENGTFRAAMDGEAMIFRKTAADSALGASILSREDSRVLLMVGAGGLAPHLVRAHLVARPGIERVMVWNRTPGRARALVDALAAEGVPAEVADDLAAAVPLADIVSCATAAREPVLRGALLKPGAHVDIVGSFRPEMRESDDDVMRRAEIFVDHRQTTGRSGDFLIPFASGVISPADVRGDLFALCQRRVRGRSGDEAITLMKNGGGSHLDYFVAKYVIDRIEGRPFSTTCAAAP